MSIQFTKMQGIGNDFIVLDLRDGGALPDKKTLSQMSDRRRGIGCDQIIPILPPKDPRADCFIRILNAPDASEVEACGNATRCIARILMDEGNKKTATIQTLAGLLHCSLENDGMINVDMGVPKIKWDKIPLSRECDTLNLPLPLDACAVNIGNPHCVLFFDDVEKVDIAKIGREYEHNALFPKHINVPFAQIIDNATIRMRMWERDTGITQACGTGACAAVVACVRRGLTGREVKVILDGGELNFHLRDDNHIIMTGAANYVFKGSYEEQR